MRGLLTIGATVDRISGWFGSAADWCVLMAVLVSALNATARYILNISSNAFLEIQWYLFGAIVLLGAARTLCRNEHVRVDLVYGSLGARGRLWIDAFGLTFFLLPISLYLLKLSWPFFAGSFASGEASPNSGGLILWPAKLLLPVGFALLAAQGVSELIKRIAALAGFIDIDTGYEKPLQ